jgi:hypothetical protein
MHCCRRALLLLAGDSAAVGAAGLPVGGRFLVVEGSPRAAQQARQLHQWQGRLKGSLAPQQQQRRQFSEDASGGGGGSEDSNMARFWR